MLSAQKYDFNWISGYGKSVLSPSGSYFGVQIFDFNTGNFRIIPAPQTELDFSGANGIISNRGGELLYYCNGYSLEYGNHMKVPGAQELNNTYGALSLADAQTVLFLPHPDGSNRYLMLYGKDSLSKIDNYGRWSTADFRYMIFDNTKDSLRGTVEIRDQILFRDTLLSGRLTACRHANGRDWWILVPERNAYGYYRVLIDNKGPHLIDKQFIQEKFVEGISQVCFSPHGDYYVSQTANHDGSFTYLFAFDRSTGLLSLKAKQVNGFSNATGVSFSPDNKLLYISLTQKVIQYDLEAVDIFNSGIIIDSIDKWPRFGLNYERHLLAPDGRIYINSSASAESIHYIEHPNIRGLGCGIHRSGIKTTYNVTLSNHPYYRLGPLDGSTCDTLGINNIPWAWWRYDQDSTEHLKIQFVDASAYEVEEWYWDFGDGNRSRDTSPLHTYSKNGVYQVCLIVKNKNGADTLCRTLYIGVVSNSDPNKNIDFQLFPNPFTSVMIINVNDYLPTKMLMTLYDLQGKAVLHRRLYQGSNVIDVEGLNSGVYVVEIKEQGIVVKSEKLVKM